MGEYTFVLYGKNLVHNPRPVGLPTFTGTIAPFGLVTDRSYSGNESVRIDFSAVNQYTRWHAAPDNDADLLLAGHTLYGKVSIAGPAQDINLRFIVDYTDGSQQVGSSVSVDIPSINFERFDIPPITLDAVKVVKRVSLDFKNLTVASQSIWVGGFDVRDNTPADGFIHGSAGTRYRWTGSANNSPSERDQFEATPIFGSGGQISPTLTVEVVNRQGQVLREITEHFRDGSITYDLDATAHKGSCTLTFDEPGLIEVLGDEMAKISIRIDRPDGTVEQGPLGVFILDPPKERWTEGQDEWIYSGRDIISLLDTTYIRGVPETTTIGLDETEVTLHKAYYVGVGTPNRTILEDVLMNDVGLNASQFSFGASLPASTDTDIAWEAYTSVLQIATDVLEGAGWLKPWATTQGIITSAPAGVNPATVVPSIILTTGNNSRVRWPFEVDPDISEIGNRVRVVSAKDVTSITYQQGKAKKKKKKNKKPPMVPVSTTTRYVVEVWRQNNDPSHPLSYSRLQRWIDIPDITVPMVSDEAQAINIADQALIEAGQLPIRVRLTTEAMVRQLNEVYELQLDDIEGNPIASGHGRYWCRGWSIQLGSPWEMVHNLSRIIDFTAASFLPGA